MNNKDIEILSALKIVYGDKFEYLDQDVARSTVFEILEQYASNAGMEIPLPYRALSEAGQLELVRQLVGLLASSSPDGSEEA
jgi:hypothetical protein